MIVKRIKISKKHSKKKNPMKKQMQMNFYDIIEI